MADHCHNAALRHAASFHSALLPYSKPHNTTCDTRSRGNGGGGGTGLVGADGEVGRGQRRGPEPVRARDRRAAVRGRVGVPDAGVGPPVRGRERDGGEGGGHDQGVRLRAHVHENVNANVNVNVSSLLRSRFRLSLCCVLLSLSFPLSLFSWDNTFFLLNVFWRGHGLDFGPQYLLSLFCCRLWFSAGYPSL